MTEILKIRSTAIRLALWLLVLVTVLAAVWLLYEAYMFVQDDPDRKWDFQLLRISVLVLVNLALAVSLTFVAVLYLWARTASSLPDLRGWHAQKPESEFYAADIKEDYSLDDYLQQESRVFSELDELVAGPWTAQATGAFSRFHADSVCNPETITDRNWNKSLVLESSNPKGGVLLLHGLSDSPYSLRVLGRRLHAEGYTVIWLRLPGHGTNPRALADVTWKDWTAAVRVAMRGLRDRLPEGTPLILGGYSNGGALSVHYALSALEEESLPRPAGLVLFSPMIGISPMAKITRLYYLVTRVFRNEKAQWSNIDAEIDPFKYCSWPMNASVQAWWMTKKLERKLAAATKSGRMKEMPPVLTMQSVVDSTVVVSKLISVLFERLPPASSELFLFDINRVGMVANLVNLSFERTIVPRLQRTDLPYKLTVLKNSAPDSRQVTVTARDGESLQEETLDLSWPDDLLSLSHVAVPIPPDDSIYGTKEATQTSGLALGSLSMRGEPSALMISNSMFVRCRHNPFYQFMEDRVVRWLSEIVSALPDADIKEEKANR